MSQLWHFLFSLIQNIFRRIQFNQEQRNYLKNLRKLNYLPAHFYNYFISINGYNINKEKAEKFRKMNIKIWNRIKIISDNTEYEGILLPRSEFDAPNFIYLKT
jgi:hypothetical protein